MSKSNDLSTAPRVERNGKVAVLVSPGFGAGWSTWADDPAAIFAPDVVEWVEAGMPPIDVDEAFGKYGYLGGLRDIEVQWVPKGSRFYIDEYDGSEQLVFVGPDFGVVA